MSNNTEKCHNCEHTLEPNWKFCPNCGEVKQEFTELVVSFSKDAYRTLNFLGKELSVTKKEVLSKLLGLGELVVREQKDGSQVIIENRKRDIRKEIKDLRSAW